MYKPTKITRQIRGPRAILPAIVALLTRRNRHLPKKLDFNWRGNVVHSLLMCYYWLFWRGFSKDKDGKQSPVHKPDVGYIQDSTGRREVQAFTFLGALLVLEHEFIRPLFRFKFVPIYLPALQPILATPFYDNSFQDRRIPILFAIAYDAGQGQAQTVSSTPTLANVAPAGSDRWMATHLNYGGGGGTVSVVPTHQSLASTIIASEVNTGDGNPKISTYRRNGPSTSSGNLTATLSVSEFWKILAQTYTGVDQTTSTNAETSNVGGSYTPSSPVDVVMASDRDGSWAFMSAKQDTAGDLTAGTGTTRRQTDATPFDDAMFDTASGTNSGSNATISVNYAGGGQRIGWQACMIRAVAVAGNTNFLLFF